MEYIVSYFRIENGRVMPIFAEIVGDDKLCQYRSNPAGAMAVASEGMDAASKPRGFVIVDDLERQIFEFQLAEPVGAVEPEHDRAILLLRERSVLTRRVCEELRRSTDPADTRPYEALVDLLQWISQNRATSSGLEARADEGLDELVPPEGFAGLLAETRAGAEVCEALFMLHTADTLLQAANDKAAIEARLARFWKQYPGNRRGMP